MNNLSIELNWFLEDGELSYGKYSTDHKIKINGKKFIKTIINLSMRAQW